MAALTFKTFSHQKLFKLIHFLINKAWNGLAYLFSFDLFGWYLGVRAGFSLFG